jgi:5S rRNA maturation endonuclease (ribonuclease M5)
MVRVAIVCEGMDDKKFFQKLLNHLRLNEGDVSFYPLGVKSNFFILNNPDYADLKLEIDNDQIGKVLFVVDADYDGKNNGGFENTQLQLKLVIKHLEIEDISSIYVMCDPDTKTGYLESFLLSTIPKDKKHCIDCFLECSGFNPKDGDKSTYKRVYQTIAHPLSPYQFEHPHFDELKQKLKNLF